MIPFNIASYAELALTLEEITGHKALAIQGDLKKVHLYDNSLEEAKELITRPCSEDRVKLNIGRADIFKLYGSDLDSILKHISNNNFWLDNYNPQPPVRVEMLSRS